MPNMAARPILLTLLALFMTAGLRAADLWTWWVDDCAAAPASGCVKGDAELARWAFEDWQRESADRIIFTKSATPRHARLTIHWTGDADLYGKTVQTTVDGQRGAAIYLLPRTGAGRSGDPLLRDTIVYLTMVHETGHALGLSHTANFEDIMYSFEYGGDITEYFARYRRRLSTRSDIQRNSALSDGDRTTLRALPAH